MAKSDFFKSSQPGPFKISVEIKGYPDPLADFPPSEHWRLVTDGWQQPLGINGFSDEYYAGMRVAYGYMKEYFNTNAAITPETIITVQRNAFLSVAMAEDKLDDVGLRPDDCFTHFGLAPYQEEKMNIHSDGIDELIAAAQLAKKEKRWYLATIDWKALMEFTGDKVAMLQKMFRKKTVENDFIDPDNANAKNILAQFLNPKCVNKLFICTCPVMREKILEFLSRDIAELNKALGVTPDDVKKTSETHTKSMEETKSVSKNEDEIIAAIVKFIQKLNQNHWFGDGNGRTCMILLNSLLVKYLGCMAIIHTPAHLTGYSTEQLVKEIKQGIAEFKKYKITDAKKLIEDFIKQPPDQKNEDEFKKNLKKLLATDNQIAMAQINALFVKFKSAKNNERVIYILKDLYVDHIVALVKKGQDLIDKDPGKKERLKNKEAFAKMLEWQEISKEFLYEDLDGLMDLYFTPKDPPDELTRQAPQV